MRFKNGKLFQTCSLEHFEGFNSDAIGLFVFVNDFALARLNVRVRQVGPEVRDACFVNGCVVQVQPFQFSEILEMDHAGVGNLRFAESQIFEIFQFR